MRWTRQVDLTQFKAIVRDQFLLLRSDEGAAPPRGAQSAFSLTIQRSVRLAFDRGAGGAGRGVR